MFRKLALALVATGTLGLAAFAPTGASAYTSGPQMRAHHHGPAVHRHFKDSRAHYRHRDCIQKRMVRTPYGPRLRTVNVCR